MKNSITKQDRIVVALKRGMKLTKGQIKARFGIANPRATISDLRMKGFPIFLREHKTTKGTTSKYELGKPSRAVIAAGYQYLAMQKMAG